MPTSDFASEEVREDAQGNATSFALGTITYLRQRGMPVEGWPALLGQALVDRARRSSVPRRPHAMHAQWSALPALFSA